MKLTGRESVLLAVLLLLLAGLAYYYLFWTGFYAKDAELKEGIGRLEAEIQNEEAVLELLPAVRAEVERLEAARETQREGILTLPERDEIPSLLDRIMPPGAVYSLTLDRTASTYAVTLTAHVTVNGPAGTLGLLLAGLDADAARCAVRRADMSVSPGGETVSLRLEFLYFSDQNIQGVFP